MKKFFRKYRVRIFNALFLLFILILIGPVFQLFTDYHAIHIGDSLLLSINSYAKLMPYYWGQDRWLMVLPALVSFIKDPGLNFFFLTWIQVFMSLGGFFLLFYLINRELPLLPFGLFVIFIVIFFNRKFWWETFFQAYGSSLFFAVISVILFERVLSYKTFNNLQRLILIVLSALFAIIAANIAQPIMAGLLIWYVKVIDCHYALLNIINKSKRKQVKWLPLLKASACWIISAIIFYIPIIVYRKYYLPPINRITVLSLVEIDVWFNGIIQLIVNLYKGYIQEPQPAFLIVSGLLLIFITFNMIIRKTWKYFLDILTWLILPAIIIVAGMATLKWVILNIHNPRYILFSSWFVVMAVILLLHKTTISLKLNTFLNKYKLSYVVVILSIIILIAKHDINFKIQTPLEHIVKTYNIPLIDIKESDSVAIIGDFYRVAPTVWAMNAAYPNYKFYGISYIFNEYKEEWFSRVLNNGKICFYPDDTEYKKYLTLQFTGYNFSEPISYSPELNLIQFLPFSNQFKDEYIFPASSLPTIIGTLDGDVLVALDGISREGFLSYGPYVNLNRGFYQFTIQYAGKTMDENAEIGMWDVNFWEQNKQVMKGPINSTEGETGLITAEFEITDDFRQVEIRTYYRGRGDLAVNEIKIRRMD